MHGIVSLALAVAAFVHFGQIFLFVCGVMAGMSAVSLGESWRKLRAGRNLSCPHAGR